MTMPLRTVSAILCLSILVVYEASASAANDKSCIKELNCTGRAYGDYEDCTFCNAYVSCAPDGAHLRICNPWQTSNYGDRLSCYPEGRGYGTICTSRAIPEIGTTGKPYDTTPKVCPGNKCCVKKGDCKNLPDGPYGICGNCFGFVHCTFGRMSEEMDCPGTLEWNDKYKVCVDIGKGTGFDCVTPTTAEPPCKWTQSCESKIDDTEFQDCVIINKDAIVTFKDEYLEGLHQFTNEAIYCTTANYAIVDDDDDFTRFKVKKGCCGRFEINQCQP